MSRVYRGFRITWKVIKFLFFALIFSLIALLLWRVFSSGDPKSMQALTPNDRLAAAYAERGESLSMFRQEQRTITSAEKNYGYFSVTECVFIPDANQIQIVVRYNNSTLRSLAADYGLPDVPSREEELFDVTLTVATDLTPEISEDNAGNDSTAVAQTRVFPTSVSRDQKNLYNYRRFVFDLGTVEMSLPALLESDGLLAVYADIYYNGDVRYDEPAYGTLCLYDYLSEKLPAKLEKQDKAVLDDYLGR